MFSMFRFLLINTFIALHSIVFCLWGILLSVCGGKGSVVHFFCAVPWARAILWVSGVKVMVKGLEHVDVRKSCIYLSNHQSYFDIFVLLASLPVNFKFVLKQELMKIPLLGRAMRGAGYIAIDREDPRKAIKSMNEAAERIKQGASVLMFPEGTRSADGNLQAFKNGGFRLAVKAGCDLVPIGIVGTGRIVPKGSLRVQRGMVAMNIGRPIPGGVYSRREMDQLMDRVRSDMEGLLKEQPSP